MDKRDETRDLDEAWMGFLSGSAPLTWSAMFSRDTLRDHPARFLFLNRTVRDTLAVLHSDPFASRSVREIAKQASTKSVSGVHGYVKEMEAAGLLVIDESSSSESRPRYRPNLDAPLLLKAFEALEVERTVTFYRVAPSLARGLKRVVTALVDETSWGIDGLYLFGSWSRGQQERSSDVDMFLVSRLEGDALESAAALSEEALGRAFHPSVVTANPARLREGLGNREPFFQELWRDRIVLYGESLFWQIVRDIASGAR